jgi:membrane fusion protein (multidrug efflux system)
MMKVTQTATTGAEVKNASPNATSLSASDGPKVVPGGGRTESTALLELQAKINRHAGGPPVLGQLPSHPMLSASSGKGNLRLALGGFAVLAWVIFLTSSYLAQVRGWVKTDNAYLATHVHSVSSRVAGTVKEVLVDENQAVTAGAVLARLDKRDFEVRCQQALAQVAQASAQVQGAEARIAQAHAQITREQARATKAKNDLTRASSLYEGGSGAISRQELDLARADSDAAEAALLEARSALDSATASAAAAQAQEKVASAGLQEANLQLSYTEIIAPASGRIGKKNLEVGNRLQPGQVVLALVQTALWVNANFKETQLTHLQPGQPVRVRVDAFPGRTFRARVESLSPGSGAQFALLPPDNATGNFTKIVQRVPVKIVLERASLGDCAGRLVAGMSAVVEVEVRD